MNAFIAHDEVQVVVSELIGDPDGARNDGHSGDQQQVEAACAAAGSRTQSRRPAGGRCCSVAGLQSPGWRVQTTMVPHVDDELYCENCIGVVEGPEYNSIPSTCGAGTLSISRPGARWPSSQIIGVQSRRTMLAELKRMPKPPATRTNRMPAVERSASLVRIVFWCSMSSRVTYAPMPLMERR